MQRAPQVLRRPSSKFYDQFNGYAPSRGLTIPPIRVVVEFTYCSDTLQLIYTDPYYISLTSSITAHKQTSTATIHIVVDRNSKILRFLLLKQSSVRQPHKRPPTSTVSRETHDFHIPVYRTPLLLK
ncbi:hypothetical protein Q1695_003175 [Nippostrongylus brasiliensis]|nr:hypothetical protein Q1695_003175 [Nippostrongylus brasiliensis]